MLSKEKLAELRGLAENATFGPWEPVSDLPDWGVATTNQPDFHPDPVVTLNRQYRAPWRKNLGCSENDARFIAASRTAIPDLLDHVQKLEAALAVATEAMKGIERKKSLTLLCRLGDYDTVTDAYSTGAHNAFCNSSEEAHEALARIGELIGGGK